MYHLVFYYLIALVLAAVVLGFFGLVPVNPWGLIFSTFVLISVSFITNKIFARIFGVPTNLESFYITALILALIITPPQTRHLFSNFPFLVAAGIISMASKYIINWRGKHIFNPAAFAVAVTAFTVGFAASWWVGVLPMVPFVLIGGLLVARKLQRGDLVATFLVVALLTIIVSTLPIPIPTTLNQMVLHSSFLFFAFVMLTEPQTAPQAKRWRLLYAALVGLLFAPNIHFGSLYSTPEFVLLVGNVFGYIVSPKGKYLLALKSKNKIGENIYDFIFARDKKLSFTPGQYLEWTLGHKRADLRGTRRYFTIASSPTENNIRLGVRFNHPGSSFKGNLVAFEPGRKLLAGQLAGEFILPKDVNQKLVFIAGGIGITPFRSMIKYLLDRGEKRSIVVLYSNKTFSEIVYEDVLFEAQEKLGVKTVITLTELDSLPADWQGQTGRINSEMIRREVPDFLDRTFYLSGPHSMVTGFEDTLKQMNIPKQQIKIDFFPGYV